MQRRFPIKPQPLDMWSKCVWKFPPAEPNFEPLPTRQQVCEQENCEKWRKTKHSTGCLPRAIARHLAKMEKWIRRLCAQQDANLSSHPTAFPHTSSRGIFSLTRHGKRKRKRQTWCFIIWRGLIETHSLFPIDACVSNLSVAPPLVLWHAHPYSSFMKSTFSDQLHGAQLCSFLSDEGDLFQSHHIEW